MHQYNSEVQLTPEFMRAIDHLEKSFDGIHLSNDPISDSIWEDNKTSMYPDIFTISKIPVGEGWKWNQTKARKRVYIPRFDLKVVFFKTIPRKRNQQIDQEIPFYKLWHYQLEHGGRQYTMFWCEKGKPPESKLYASRLSYILN